MNLKENFGRGFFCSGSNEIKDAKADFIFLKDRLSNNPEPKIYGSVKLYENQTYTYLQGIKAEARKGKRKFTTFTDKNRIYQFNYLPNGQYKISPVLFQKYILDVEINSLDRKINLVSNSDKDYGFLSYTEFFGKHYYTDFKLTGNYKFVEKTLKTSGK